MVDINAEDASKRHGVSTLHSVMPNGELRFRLKKSDGTAYIRTEASANGAWQESHYHLTVMETYIVQTGWIAFATKSDKYQRKIIIYKEGEIFSTTNGIIHTVYMPVGAVIHTVKHGSCHGDDRTTSVETKEFDAEIAELKDEATILSQADKPIGPLNYSPTYRHFDKLIWQTPVWTTTILNVTLIGLDSSKQSFLTKLTGLPERVLTLALVTLMAFVLIGASHAVYRFRAHQKRARSKSRVQTPIWKSASTYLSAVVVLEAAAMVCLDLVIYGVQIFAALAICLAGAIGWFSYREAMLRA